MIKVFKWFTVQDCLPQVSIVAEGTTTWHGQENSEVLNMITEAMISGELKVYDAQVRLQPPPKDVDLTHYLWPAKVNKWFIANELPYEWNPEKIGRPLSLTQRKNNGELKQASIKAAQYLKSTGTEEQKISLQTVADEIVKQNDWGYTSETIKPMIRVSWWKESIR